MRWLWAALSVGATLYLCAYHGNTTVIVINVVLDAWIIYGALRGR